MHHILLKVDVLRELVNVGMPSQERRIMKKEKDLKKAAKGNTLQSCSFSSLCTSLCNTVY